MGDFVELIIFLAIVFFSLLAGGSKKKRQARGGARSRPQPLPQREERVQRNAAPGGVSSREARAKPPARHNLAQQIFDMLSEQLPDAVDQRTREPDPAEAVTLDQVDVEARSLETLEPAGDVSHERFHERYVDDSQPARVLRRKGRISPANAREAVIWKAIFSPPKGME